MKRLGYVLLAACAIPTQAADVRVIEEIIAKVNNEIITRSELDRSRKQLEAELRAQGLTGAKLDQANKEREKDVLRTKIDTLLLVQKGKELNINVDPEVSKYLADIQLRAKIGDPEKFQQFIRDQSGQPFEDFKSDIKNQILTRRVIGQEVGSRVHVPKAEAAKYYDEHKKEFVREERVFLREILISTQGKTDKEVAALEKKAKDVVARARKGEKFVDLVRDNSDADTAQSGGELPPWERGKLEKKIEDVVFSQDRGYVTDPIRVPNGFLILKVEERHKAGQAQLEEVENEITERLYMPRFEPEVRKYLTRLRMEAFLEIRDGFIDSAAAPGKDTRWQDPAQLKPATVTKEEVASKPPHRRRLLWIVPVPGTTTGKAKSTTK